MWTNKQKALVAQARRELGLDDTDYRADLALICKATTSKAAHLDDRDLDRLLAYWEAVLERRTKNEEQGTLRRKVFRSKGYWRQKNTAHNTSRDRYTKAHAEHDAAHFEDLLLQAGKTKQYLQAINRNCGFEPIAYRAALARTCKSLRL